MDPNACLMELRELTRMVNDGEAFAERNLERIAELVEALDGWLSRGGFLPTVWQR